MTMIIMMVVNEYAWDSSASHPRSYSIQNLGDIGHM